MTRNAVFALCTLPLLVARAPGAQDPPPETGEPPELTWESLEARLAAEAAAGFSGALLVVREGEIVLEAGYGLAHRERGVACTPDTIFAIGSTPIDFTKAALWLLIEDGKLALDEPLPRFFDGVPEDKRAITVEHLMTGRSGLRDFHDLPGDRDPDHHWIDRAEAVRRILAQELLFAPGQGEEHSHSAWGLLAAMIEIRSGQSYPAFTRARLFGPAGMRDTGFFGEEVAPERLALGYGPRSDGEVNAPPYWGPTSWLVMGSGGMTSTLRDMHRWLRALRGGKLLGPESLARYWSPPGALLAGGDAYGFEILYTEGPDDYFILLSNQNVRPHRQAFERLGQDLFQLVLGEARPPYSLGVELAVEARAGEGGAESKVVLVRRVLPGSAAEEGGLRAGDVLLAAGGTPLAPDLWAVLDGYLRSGARIVFTVERAGTRSEVEVRPRKR